MRLGYRLLTLAFATLAALVLFHLLHREIVGVLPGAGVAGEVVGALERSQADMKELAAITPGRRDELHRRFDEVQALANHLRIVDHNREAIAERQRNLVLTAAAIAFVGLALAIGLAARRDARRLDLLGEALAGLAAARPSLRVGVRGRDPIGLVARMIERTSDVVTRDRQRLASLRNLAAWQEGARRQVHELRTPLTVIRLELDRIEEGLTPGDASVVSRFAELRQEIGRLEDLVRRFTSFAKLPVPDRRRHDLREVVRDFVAAFADVWPGLALRAEVPATACMACVDRAMIRQVLVNLCENSARALRGRNGEVTLTLRAEPETGVVAVDVADDGPGVAPEIRDRLFEPYASTAEAGQGMGLGLAISRKILLDHGGDLELARSASGARFRLLLPAEVSCPE